jgi:hypothetical protein
MAKSIISHRVTRGSTVHFVGTVGFADFKGAVCAWSAVAALQEQRDACLAMMRESIGNESTFNVASRREAELSAQIRRLRNGQGRRHRNGSAIPLTTADQNIYQRAGDRQEREYREADRMDAEIVTLRLQRGGIVANVKAGVRS